MERLMRKLAAIICLWTLAACGQPATPAGEQAPAQTEASGDGPVVLATTRNMPDWLLVLRTNDGGTIHFNQRTITRENGFADIWLQVRYGREQLWEADTETTERVIRYELERMHYRFNCAEETFIVVERQIMGASEQVVARDEPRQIYRQTPITGAARHIMPIACRGA
jgi:predicted small lipoprotein YifL